MSEKDKSFGQNFGPKKIKRLVSRKTVRSAKDLIPYFVTLFERIIFQIFVKPGVELLRSEVINIFRELADSLDIFSNFF